MKSLMWLLRCTLAEAGVRCGTDTHADCRTIVRRCEHEGDSFLTITLPSFAKALERALADGAWSSASLTGFRHRGGLPVFLQGFLRQVFTPNGELLDDPSVEAIRSIRQICLMWKKIHLPCSTERVLGAFNDYIKCDEEVGRAVDNTPVWSYDLFGRVSDVLWSTVLHDADYTAVFREYLPRHGPGATAEKVTGNSKWTNQRWTFRLQQQYFPYQEFANGRAYWAGEECGDLKPIILCPEQETPVRVIAVPKTLTAPRIIAIEPVCMQYTQQALLPLLVEALESHPFTKGKVNFTCQSFNREAALLSSRTGKTATLDMKEASDRVPLQLVERMLDSVPDLLGAILATRSRFAAVPTSKSNLRRGSNHAKRVIGLNKFASMGSALCFPIEAMVFYTIIIAARLHAANATVTPKNIVRYSKDVLVYGDDIVVPVDSVQDVVKLLEAFGLKVNCHKSFWTGKFRESCGLDAYDGEDVTPFYVRSAFPDSIRSASEVASWVSLANQAYKKGWWQVAKTTRDMLEAKIGPLPHVDERSPALGWHSFLGTRSVHRYDPSLQRFEISGLMVKTKRKKDPILDPNRALLKCLLTTVGSPSVDEDHLERSVRRGAVHIERHWTSI